ncbi:hypothetical protein FS749_003941 [Ceratobasidium sp. UAMH 11750]|nr:hypothetical protein FS749_003941 [Ceratobasidium sp. UAMH 11750]
MSTFSSPMSRTTPPINNLGRATYFETPRPHNLAGSRNPSSYSNVASSTTQFHRSVLPRYSSPANNQALLPDDASRSSASGKLETPNKPPAALLHSSSTLLTSNFATEGAAHGKDSEYGAGLNEPETMRRRWTWKRALLWLVLALVVVAGVAVGVGVSLMKRRQTGGSASIQDVSTTTSSTIVIQQATVPSSTGEATATVPDTTCSETSDPFPTPTPYVSVISSSTEAGYPVPTDLPTDTYSIDPFQTGPLATSTVSSPPGYSVCEVC